MSAALNSAISRLRREAARLQSEKLPFLTAIPSPNDILEWHYVIEGPPETVYAGGYYYGMLKFPKDYPFKPPSIYMNTPNGRFHTNNRICLSVSDFHPETWNPAWSVGSILTGLLSFMLDDDETHGSTVSTDEEKRVLAQKSIAFNLKSEKFRTLFPELTEKLEGILTNQQAAEADTDDRTTTLISFGSLLLIRSHIAIILGTSIIMDLIDVEASNTWTTETSAEQLLLYSGDKWSTKYSMKFIMELPALVTTRLRKEALQLQQESVPFVTALPSFTNILKWYYVLEGPEDSVYSGGFYYGRIDFPTDYPFKPPRISMITPNGRFQTDRSLCLSITHSHPETWSPAWTVGTILTALLSFMLEDTPTDGSLTTSSEEKTILAKQSIEFNLQDETFRNLFPDLVKKLEAILASRQGPSEQTEEAAPSKA